MIGRVLVPLDGSKLAEGVLPYVEELGRRLGTQIIFVHVVDSGFPMAIPESATIEAFNNAVEQTERDRKAAGEYLAGLAAAWRAAGLQVAWQVADTTEGTRGGTPASKIIELAHSLEADMIAMSTHGRSGLSRLFFGSVADRVLRESGVPVLLIRSGQKKAKVRRDGRDEPAAANAPDAA
jgi:nucleotide-binding universal stress UspA family protein